LEGQIVMCVFDSAAETLEHGGNADGNSRPALRQGCELTRASYRYKRQNGLNFIYQFPFLVRDRHRHTGATCVSRFEPRWGKEIPSSPSRPDRSCGPPSLLYNGYWSSFLGVKRPKRGVDHPPTSTTEV
jgi:hypothetical protein